MAEAYKYQTSLIVTNVLLIGASAYTALRSTQELFYVTLGMLIVSFLPHYLKRRFDFHVPMIFVYGAVAFIFTTIGLGQINRFYERYPWWDAVLHFGSALALGIIGFLILYCFYVTKKLETPKWLIAFFGFTFAISLGVLWEIFEFVIDKNFRTNLQVGSLDDTLWDLVLDAGGAFIAALAGYLYLLRIPVPIVEGIVEEFTIENTTVVSEEA